ncbi:hypothetical protein NDU88_002018 [Pleurodeles waltl]|uniref:Uncharacterized protein n=1 Tax=Pleurodeles waltl TaxID=8319 RepID=A0AAV7S916_PLEWA|nr:hypothetical protein NDU88_002018 [Pleurodeles waltl]
MHEEGEDNQPNQEQGFKGRPDHIINMVNESFLAAVKALTWQPDKMEIHLELTHILAQSVLALDDKLNLLSGKLDKLGNMWQNNNATKGTRNHKLIDKQTFLPDLLTSLIQHGITGDERKKMKSGTPVEKQRVKLPIELTHIKGPSASIELMLKRKSSALKEGEEGSKEMELDNRQQSMTHPMRLTTRDINIDGNSIEEQGSGLIAKTSRESDIRNNQQLSRRQKNKLKKSLKVAKKTTDRTA